MPTPKKGPGQYSDDFLVRRVEGGFLLQIEFTEMHEPTPGALVNPNTGEQHAVDLSGIVPPHMRNKLREEKHVRQVVCKSGAEVISHLKEWMEGSTS